MKKTVALFNINTPSEVPDGTDKGVETYQQRQ